MANANLVAAFLEGTTTKDVDKVVLTDSGDDTNPTTVALRTAIKEKYGIKSTNVDNVKSRFDSRLREYLREIFKDYIDEE